MLVVAALVGLMKFDIHTPLGEIGRGVFIACDWGHTFSANPRLWLIIVNNSGQGGRPMMQYRDDDKAKAARLQLDLCQRMAQEASDPAMAEKLRNLAEKLKAQAPLQNRGLTPPLRLPDAAVDPCLGWRHRLGSRLRRRVRVELRQQ